MDFLEKINNFDETIKAKIEEKRVFIETEALPNHPLKIGDIVKVNTNTHSGKSMEVTHVLLEKIDNEKYIWKAIGIIKKDDGSLGSFVGEWTRNI